MVRNVATRTFVDFVKYEGLHKEMPMLCRTGVLRILFRTLLYLTGNRS